MHRVYIENDNARITFEERARRLTVELYGGERLEGLVARRLFPVTGADRYISLVDENGHERAIVRDPAGLMPDSRAALAAALEEYYLVPHIRKIRQIEEKFGLIRIVAETDRGVCRFEIGDRTQGIKQLFDGRVLLRDTNDDRYEVEDIRLLDKKSRDILLL